MHRRTLLKYLALNTLTIPLSLHAKQQNTQKNNTKNKRLILIELKGGNDGLNTVIPYQNPLYYKLRPNIAIPKNTVLPLTETLALHPSLKQMKEIFDLNELAIIQGIGYSEPNLSHFRSIEIWDTASKSSEYLDNGWLNTLDFSNHIDFPRGVVLGGEYGPLSGYTKGIIKVDNIKTFLRQSKKITSDVVAKEPNDTLLHILETEREIDKSTDILKKTLSNDKDLPFSFQKSKFGKQLETTAKLINSGLDISFYKVSLGSFDTHFNQVRKHEILLKQLSDGIATLRKNLIKSGEWDNTLIMTYSEFGRRASENGSKGTDHGTAAPHFITGGSVKGGIYGDHPSMSNLDSNDNFQYTTDLRSVYKTVAKEWFHTSSKQLTQFTPVPFLLPS